MRGHIRVIQPKSEPEHIGADLIREARRIERESLLLDIRRKVNAISTYKSRGTYEYSTSDRLPAEVKDEVLAVIDALLTEALR